jgi:two-component system nitrogen regulation sensor histidine kinase GlnL
VIDNGRGIPEDIRDHLFDPFVSGRVGGSGLGLAMVASVIADHGGLMEVDTVPGETVFRLNFPATSIQQSQSAHKREEANI